MKWTSVARIDYQIQLPQKTQWEFVIPTKPITVNHTYDTGKGGKRFKNTNARTFEEIALLVFAPYCHELKDSPNALLGVSYTMFFSDWGKDIDNHIKLVQDCMSRTLGFNDNRIVEVVARKQKDKDNPRIEIQLWIVGYQ